ncbi:galactose-3-O-sulfotransferase 2-like [Babylonia areolata]|uniref:galactose-3-O-sulfotransferase 2-like n=1 Tax=Babylonia areolata TaxID=304850 RepID=UPI003FD64B72
MMPAASSKAGRASAMSGCRDSHGANGGRGSNPVRHVFFLKTHKTGSQTMTGILNRYALVHNLSVAIRKALNRHKASTRKNWIPDIRPLPPGIPHYDMITDHVRFNEICVRHFLPDDAVFISIVREPLDKFVSAFYFYNMERRIPRLRSRSELFMSFTVAITSAIDGSFVERVECELESRVCRKLLEDVDTPWIIFAEVYSAGDPFMMQNLS